MKRDVEKMPYEFILYINNNIVCQRYFNIKNFNQESINSLEIRDVINDCCNIVKSDLKQKTFEYLYKYFNPYVEQKLEEIDRRNIYDNEDFFDLEIKIDVDGTRKTVARQRFTGNVYPPKVRYSVDIRELIPKIISCIQSGLSKKNYSEIDSIVSH